MPSRRKRKIATIKCAVELATLSVIAQASGLVVERADQSDQFHVLDSGRIHASELKSVLWGEMTAKLDQAVSSGAIPVWSCTT
jgi:hypothetical protein